MMIKKKATIAELESMLSDPDVSVEIRPDGSVVSLGAGPEHEDNVILTFREELGGDY